MNPALTHLLAHCQTPDPQPHVLGLREQFLLADQICSRWNGKPLPFFTGKMDDSKPVADRIRSQLCELATVSDESRFTLVHPIKPGKGIAKYNDPQDKTVIVRRETSSNLDTLRKTIAVYLLNQEIGLETVPDTRVFLWNGALVFVSDFVGGTFGWSVTPHEIHAKNETAYLNTLAFEFLVGNADVKGDNFRVGAAGQIHVIDHDMAFVLGLAQYYRGFRFGMLFPDKVTKGFSEALQALDDSLIDALLGKLLTTDEILNLKFRRDMFLVFSKSARPCRF